MSEIDNAGQALEGMLARWTKDTDGSNTTTGSNTAYVIQLNRSGITTRHSDIGRICCRFHTANNGACTIVVNSLAAKPLEKSGGAALITGDILTNDIKIFAGIQQPMHSQVLGSEHGTDNPRPSVAFDPNQHVIAGRQLADGRQLFFSLIDHRGREGSNGVRFPMSRRRTLNVSSGRSWPR